MPSDRDIERRIAAAIEVSGGGVMPLVLACETEDEVTRTLAALKGRRRVKSIEVRLATEAERQSLARWRSSDP